MVSQLVVGVFGCGSFDFVLEQVVGAQFTIVTEFYRQGEVLHAWQVHSPCILDVYLFAPFDIVHNKTVCGASRKCIRVPFWHTDDILLLHCTSGYSDPLEECVVIES